jgi:hypothetical protein
MPREIPANLAWHRRTARGHVAGGIDVDMRLLGRADRLACRVDMCPGDNESAEKRKPGRINKDT